MQSHVFKQNIEQVYNKNACMHQNKKQITIFIESAKKWSSTVNTLLHTR